MNRFRIPRKYALQTAPVALICILLFPLLINLHAFFSIVYALLSVWFWLQWPRRKSAYVGFFVAFLVLNIVPLLFIIDVVSSGIPGKILERSALLCDCLLGLLVSSAICIIARLAVSWRFVDTLVNAGDAESPDSSARGSILDLIAVVSACAGIFALVRFRLEGNFGYEAHHVTLAILVSALSTLTTIGFIRLFAPFAWNLQLAIFIVAGPLFVACLTIALVFARPMTQYKGDLVSIAITMTLVSAIFVFVSSQCHLRLHGFAIRGLGPGLQRALLGGFLIAVVGFFFTVLNSIRYGLNIGGNSLRGWPIPFQSTVFEQQSWWYQDNKVWDTTGFAVDIAVGLTVSTVIGVGMTMIISNFVFDKAASHRRRRFWMRSSFWMALMIFAVFGLFALSCNNASKLIADASFEQRSYANKVFFAREGYTKHPIDWGTSQVLSLFGVQVPSEVITEVDTWQLDNPDQIAEICDLPYLRYLTIAGQIGALPRACAESLANHKQLNSLFIGDAVVDAAAMKKIATLPSLLTLSIDSLFPNVPIEFGKDVDSISIDLRECEQKVRFPERVSLLELSVSDKTDLSGLRGTYRIKQFVLDCSDRTTEIRCPVTELDKVTLYHGTQDISLRLSDHLRNVAFFAAHSPELNTANPREPHITVRFFALNPCSFEFANSSCQLTRTHELPVDSITVSLKSTKEKTLADQLKFLQETPAWTLHMKGEVDEKAVQQLARLTNLDVVNVLSGSTKSDVLANALEEVTIPSLASFLISGVRFTDREFDKVLKALPNLEVISTSGQDLSSIDLTANPKLYWFELAQSPGLDEIKLGEIVPSGRLAVSGELEANSADLVMKGPAFNGDVVSRLLLEGDASSVVVEDSELTSRVWTDMYFGPSIKYLELCTIPTAKMVESWSFPNELKRLSIQTKGEIPPQLLIAAFETTGAQFLDFRVETETLDAWRELDGRRLSLAGRKITPELINAIMSIDQLRELDLSDTNVTTDQLIEIKSRSPELKVVNGVQSEPVSPTVEFEFFLR